MNDYQMKQNPGEKSHYFSLSSSYTVMPFSIYTHIDIHLFFYMYYNDNLQSLRKFQIP